MEEEQVKVIKEKWKLEASPAIQSEASNNLIQYLLSSPINKSNNNNNNNYYVLLTQKGFLNTSCFVFEPCFDGVCLNNTFFFLISFIILILF